MAGLAPLRRRPTRPLARAAPLRGALHVHGPLPSLAHPRRHAVLCGGVVLAGLTAMSLSLAALLGPLGMIIWVRPAPGARPPSAVCSAPGRAQRGP